MISKSTYLTLTEIHSELPIFYQPWYMDISGIEWDVWMYEGDDYKVFFPFYKEKKLFFRLSRPMAPFMPYYGPYFLSETKLSAIQIQDALSLLFEELPVFSELYLCPHYSTQLHQLATSRFEEKKMVTHILDLQKAKDQLWNELDYMRRKNIKKAEKELRISEQEFNVEMYYEWIKSTYQRRGETLQHSLEFYKKFCSKIIEHQAAIYYTLYDKDENPIAVSFCIKDTFTAYSILGANNPAIKNSAATTALLWKSIQQAKEEGCHRFDFEGSTIESIASFFRKFGGERIDYSVWYQTNSILWKLKKKWR